MDPDGFEEGLIEVQPKVTSKSSAKANSNRPVERKTQRQSEGQHKSTQAAIGKDETLKSPPSLRHRPITSSDPRAINRLVIAIDYGATFTGKCL
jgi:hypothetical protein